MYRKSLLAGIATMALFSSYTQSAIESRIHAADDANKTDVPKVLTFGMNSLEGQPVDMKKYAGKVIMFVNVASKCGYTNQYEGLQKLHERYKDKGLALIGVPCNQFGAQEQGNSKEIREFCTNTYKVTFDMMEKVNVNDKGDAKACDLYRYLTNLNSKPKSQGNVSWNFEKFILDRKGNLIGRFESKVKPDDPAIIELIEKALGEK